ncbi:MAG: hypothetical protein WB870_03985 [Gallionellaceae bacterium]
MNQSPAMRTPFRALRAIKRDLPEPHPAVAALENPAISRQDSKKSSDQHPPRCLPMCSWGWGSSDGAGAEHTRLALKALRAFLQL